MEDASPMAHPVRPDSYIAIDNFYTATVYQKGAEVVRMIHTLLGADGFRRGMDLYVQRHDGQAVTCDDFVDCMADANKTDLEQFRRWYAQSGTPELTVSWHWDAARGSMHLKVEQSCLPTPGQPTKEPFHLPLAIGMLDKAGADLPVQLAGETVAPPAGTRVLQIRKPVESIELTGFTQEPVPSLLRGFSAPVKLHAERSPETLQFLAANDSDPFARWEAFQDLALADIRARIGDANASGAISPGLLDAFTRTLGDRRLDDAFIALALTLPTEGAIGDGLPVIDVDGIHRTRQDSRVAIGLRLAQAWRATSERCADPGPYRYDGRSAGRRALANLALGYRVVTADAEALRTAMTQLVQATNMTDQFAALAMLSHAGGSSAEEAIAWFEQRWQGDTLVMDKWFSVQATAPDVGVLDRIANLLHHPGFDAQNPNKLYALVGSFASGNAVRFHDRSGRGYAFLTDRVLETDPFNPKIAARLVGHLGRWRRYDTQRQGLMRASLDRILSHSGLSRDVFEIASKSQSETS
jgi:aminopeptidase N